MASFFNYQKILGPKKEYKFRIHKIDKKRFYNIFRKDNKSNFIIFKLTV